VVGLLALIGLWLSPAPLLCQVDEPTTEPFPITGTVKDAEDGTPLQYAIVGVPELGSWALSEADGAFALEVAGPGIFRFVVVKRGWYPADQEVTFAGPDDLPILLYKEREDAPVGPGRFVGRVLDQRSGNPVSNATIRITPTNQQTRTDSRGRFIISEISAGAVLVEVERSGYVTRTDTLATFPGVTLGLEIGLGRDATEPPAVTVEVWPRYLEAVGFYRRAERSRGNRFGRTFIQEQNAHSISDLLRNLPGLRVETGRFGQRVITTRSTGGDRCALGVFIDNSRMPGFDIDTYPVQLVEAIEVYERFDVPMEFSDPCGAILIWSRRPE
jgi:hypothetical protein